MTSELQQTPAFRRVYKNAMNLWTEIIIAHIGGNNKHQSAAMVYYRAAIKAGWTPPHGD